MLCGDIDTKSCPCRRSELPGSGAGAGDAALQPAAAVYVCFTAAAWQGPQGDFISAAQHCPTTSALLLGV